jgi:hypothetical protein
VSIEGLALALTRPIPVAILCAAALLKAYLVFSILPTRVKGWDFDLYYVSALALRENQNPYTLDYKALAARLGIAVVQDWKSHDTPTLLVVFKPLTTLPMEEAFWIWTSLNAVALAVTLFMLLRLSRTGLSPSMGLTIAAMTILYDPVAMNSEYAQRQNYDPAAAGRCHARDGAQLRLAGRHHARGGRLAACFPSAPDGLSRAS